MIDDNHPDVVEISELAIHAQELGHNVIDPTLVVDVEWYSGDDYGLLVTVQHGDEPRAIRGVYAQDGAPRHAEDLIHWIEQLADLAEHERQLAINESAAEFTDDEQYGKGNWAAGYVARQRKAAA